MELYFMSFNCSSCAVICLSLLCVHVAAFSIVALVCKTGGCTLIKEHGWCVLRSIVFRKMGPGSVVTRQL